MPEMSPVPEDHPMMIAWNKYKQTEDYANTLRWLGRPPQEPSGTLWAAFIAGYAAACPPKTTHGADNG